MTNVKFVTWWVSPWKYMFFHCNHFHNFNKLRLKSKSYIHSIKLQSNLSFDVRLANGGLTFLICRCVCPSVSSLDAFCAQPILGFLSQRIKSTAAHSKSLIKYVACHGVLYCFIQWIFSPEVTSKNGGFISWILVLNSPSRLRKASPIVALPL